MEVTSQAASESHMGRMFGKTFIFCLNECFETVVFFSRTVKRPHYKNKILQKQENIWKKKKKRKRHRKRKANKKNKQTKNRFDAISLLNNPSLPEVKFNGSAHPCFGHLDRRSSRKPVFFFVFFFLVFCFGFLFFLICFLNLF